MALPIEGVPLTPVQVNRVSTAAEKFGRLRDQTEDARVALQALVDVVVDAHGGDGELNPVTMRVMPRAAQEETA